MDKESFKLFIGKIKTISYQDKYDLVRYYIKEKKDVDYNPTNVNIHELDQAFPYAFEYYMQKFNGFVLRDNKKKVIKYYL